ncbi:MAG: response regulator transcription factor [Ferrovibrio sp.]|uniref:response regulator transcription factor n=1 Tax=Ferrovibrio sp. TaxID=1917215 RepID=UPI002602A588|nr:response regulator transcription factor [Ferrovibrio sp.]MCW0235207.1 response regulator transcription factor [Ferrovibrio sp.]
MNRILVVEDEPSLRGDLVEYLTMQGFAVDGVGTARDLRAELAKPDKPAIVILDIGLPDGNGFDLAGEIRARHDCGIIMLTALGEADDRIRGFESGADIYLVKHSSLREIEATVQSLLRRLQDPGNRAVGRAPDQWRLHTATWNLVAPNRSEIKLTATELAFVTALLERAGQPCSREELAQLLARPQTSWDNRHLDAVVNRLRRKIKDYAQIEAPIKMIYGRGYAFSAPGRIEV